MMRLVFKAMLVVCLAVGIGNYMIYLKTGRLPVSEWKNNINLESFNFSAQQVIEETKSATKEAVTGHFSDGDKSAATKIYKWTDENGVVHYGERPADAGAQLLDVSDGNVTILPASDSSPGIGDQLPSSSQPIDPVAAIENAETPIEKARAAAEAMKAHNEMQSQY